MSRRRLRRALARLLLAAPLLPVAGCTLAKTSCDDFDSQPFEQTFTTESVTFADGGTVVASTTCEELCAMRVESGPPCTVVERDGSGVPVSFTCKVTPICEGRRPEGLSAPGTPSGDADVAGAFWARVAHLEAASVPAFERLAGELRALGAPERLVRAALRASADEVRHARATGALARRLGAEPAPVEVAPFQPRSLEALAVENAVEGCVREAYGALQAAWQARAARDSRVRQTLAAIAHEELRHAELAWEVDAWARSRLDTAARARVEAARDEALRQLRADVEASLPDVRLVRDAGLPTREQAGGMVEHLAEALLGARPWARA